MAGKSSTSLLFDSTCLKDILSNRKGQKKSKNKQSESLFSLIVKEETGVLPPVRKKGTRKKKAVRTKVKKPLKFSNFSRDGRRIPNGVTYNIFELASIIDLSQDDVRHVEKQISKILLSLKTFEEKAKMGCEQLLGEDFAELSEGEAQIIFSLCGVSVDTNEPIFAPIKEHQQLTAQSNNEQSLSRETTADEIVENSSRTPDNKIVLDQFLANFRSFLTTRMLILALAERRGWVLKNSLETLYFHSERKPDDFSTMASVKEEESVQSNQLTSNSPLKESDFFLSNTSHRTDHHPTGVLWSSHSNPDIFSTGLTGTVNVRSDKCLPPLRSNQLLQGLRPKQRKRVLQEAGFDSSYSRATPRVLHSQTISPGFRDQGSVASLVTAQEENKNAVNIDALRWELEVAQESVKQLDRLVDTNIAWVQSNCDMSSYAGNFTDRAKAKCQRMAVERMTVVFSTRLHRVYQKAFHQWLQGSRYFGLIVVANKYSKLKGMVMMAQVVGSALHRQYLRGWLAWLGVIRWQIRKEQEKASVSIQRIVRGGLGRNRVRALVEAKNAILIQKMFRKTKAILLVKQKREQREEQIKFDRAKEIQKFLQGRQQIRLAKEEAENRRQAKAVLRIQRVHRGVQGRRRFTEQQKERDRRLEEERLAELEWQKELQRRFDLEALAAAAPPHEEPEEESKEETLSVEEEKPVIPAVMKVEPLKNDWEEEMDYAPRMVATRPSGMSYTPAPAPTSLVEEPLITLVAAKEKRLECEKRDSNPPQPAPQVKPSTPVTPLGAPRSPAISPRPNTKSSRLSDPAKLIQKVARGKLARTKSVKMLEERRQSVNNTRRHSTRLQQHTLTSAQKSNNAKKSEADAVTSIQKVARGKLARKLSQKLLEERIASMSESGEAPSSAVSGTDDGHYEDHPEALESQETSVVQDEPEPSGHDFFDTQAKSLPVPRPTETLTSPLDSEHESPKSPENPPSPGALEETSQEEEVQATVFPAEEEDVVQAEYPEPIPAHSIDSSELNTPLECSEGEEESAVTTTEIIKSAVAVRSDSPLIDIETNSGSRSGSPSRSPFARFCLATPPLSAGRFNPFTGWGKSREQKKLKDRDVSTAPAGVNTNNSLSQVAPDSHEQAKLSHVDDRRESVLSQNSEVPPQQSVIAPSEHDSVKENMSPKQEEVKRETPLQVSTAPPDIASESSPKYRPKPEQSSPIPAHLRDSAPSPSADEHTEEATENMNNFIQKEVEADEKDPSEAHALGEAAAVTAAAEAVEKERKSRENEEQIQAAKERAHKRREEAENRRKEEAAKAKAAREEREAKALEEKARLAALAKIKQKSRDEIEEDLLKARLEEERRQKERKEAQEAAALRIQRVFKWRQAINRVRRRKSAVMQAQRAAAAMVEWAALSLQRVARGKSGRKRFRKLQVERKNKEIELRKKQEAAEKIQSRARGMRDRRHAEQSRQLEKQQKLQKEREEALEAERLVEEKRMMEEAEQRRKVKEEEERRAAAVKAEKLVGKEDQKDVFSSLGSVSSARRSQPPTARSARGGARIPVHAPRVRHEGENWVQLWDADEESHYWYCERTQVAQWEKPGDELAYENSTLATNSDEYLAASERELEGKELQDSEQNSLVPVHAMDYQKLLNNESVKGLDEKLKMLEQLEKSIREKEQHMLMVAQASEERAAAMERALKQIEEKAKRDEEERKQLMLIAAGPMSNRSDYRAQFSSIGSSATARSHAQPPTARSARGGAGIPPDAPRMQHGGEEWVQLWDPDEVSYYWYCERTQLAQWETPGEEAAQYEGSQAGTWDSASGVQSDQAIVVYDPEEHAEGGDLFDWQEYWDEQAQAKYWYNNSTGEASWTRPNTTHSDMDSVYTEEGGGTEGAPPFENPNDWVSYLDEVTEQAYWYNIKTGETSWA